MCTQRTIERESRARVANKCSHVTAKMTTTSKSIHICTDIRLDRSIFDGCHSQCTQHTLVHPNKIHSTIFVIFCFSVCVESNTSSFLANNAFRFRHFGFEKTCQNKNIAQNACVVVECVCPALNTAYFISRRFEFYAFNLSIVMVAAGSC